MTKVTKGEVSMKYLILILSVTFVTCVTYVTPVTFVTFAGLGPAGTGSGRR